jgi:hypothetical protein
MTLSKTKGLPAFKELLDHGHGVIDALGGQTHDISEGKSFTQTGQEVAENMDQSHGIIAPVKGIARALEKAHQDAAEGEGVTGDLRGVQDAVRGTITVPTAQEIAPAIDEIVKQSEAKGWKVERTKGRLADHNGSNRHPRNGYGDTTLYIRAPEAGGKMVSELQVNTNPMFWAKQVGPGHELYEMERQIKGQAEASGHRDLTPAEKNLIQTIQDTAKPIYNNAWGVSQHGGVVGDPKSVIIGNEHAQQQLQGKITALRSQTDAIMHQGAAA